MARRTQEEVDRYDLDAEASELAASVRNAVATVAVAEAGAVGLGALVVAAASTVAVDVTGILAASLLAGLGLFVLPNKRRQAKRDFHVKAEELEQRLIEVMREQFEHELARSMDRVREAISPYTRFVRSQFEHLEQMRTQLTAVDNDMRALRHRIGGEPRLATGERAPALPGAAPAELPEGTGGPALDEIIDAELVGRRSQNEDGTPERNNLEDGTRPEDISSVLPPLPARFRGRATAATRPVGRRGTHGCAAWIGILV